MMDNNFVRKSLELNLFFLRIMKEHSLFMSVGFIEKNRNYIDQALNFNKEFNALLNQATELSRGLFTIGDDAVTDYTMDAENVVMNQTGVPVDTRLTQMQMNMRKQSLTRLNTFDLVGDVRTLNNRAIELTSRLIRYKSDVLNDQLNCKIFYNVYPLLIDHIRREAILFVDLLNKLQNNDHEHIYEELASDELFWNQIMEEHSEFIRGLLDPSEANLIEIADDFAEEYEELNRRTYAEYKTKGISNQVRNEALALTKEIKGFKTQAVQGLLACQIKSMISPLLADHVLRESNHYIKLLENVRKH